MFRRITSEQLQTSGAVTPLVFLKKHAVLLFQKAFDDIDVDLDHFNVSLTYKDTDGDQMIIHTPDDLTAALKEYMDVGKIKIFALVQEKISDKAEDNKADAKSHTSTQTTNSHPSHSDTLNVTDAVEHVVGALASATIMAANQVTRSFREIKRVERKIIKPIRVVGVKRMDCRAKTIKKQSCVKSSSTLVDHKDVSKTSSEIKPPCDEENMKSIDSSTTTSSQVHGSIQKQSDRKPASRCQENHNLSDDNVVNGPPFIHGRHTCDGCLNTPIIGKRFHSDPDYDLCEVCFINYTGERSFREVELGKSTLDPLSPLCILIEADNTIVLQIHSRPRSHVSRALENPLGYFSSQGL